MAEGLRGPAPAAFHNGTLELSYDDGVTWHKAHLTRTSDGRGWRTELNAPKGARFVTVRPAPPTPTATPWSRPSSVRSD